MLRGWAAPRTPCRCAQHGWRGGTRGLPPLPLLPLLVLLLGALHEPAAGQLQPPAAVRTGAQLVDALANSSVSAANLLEDIELLEADFQGRALPIVLQRDFVIDGGLGQSANGGPPTISFSSLSGGKASRAFWLRFGAVTPLLGIPSVTTDSPCLPDSFPPQVELRGDVTLTFTRAISSPFR